MGYNLEQMHPSEYMRAEDIGQQEWPAQTYGMVVEEGTKYKSDVPEDKYNLQLTSPMFQGIKKLTLNKTNATRLAELFGNDTDKWVGHSILLYTEMTSTGKSGIRIRQTPPGGVPGMPPQAPPAPQPYPAAPQGGYPPQYPQPGYAPQPQYPPQPAPAPAPQPQPQGMFPGTPAPQYPAPAPAAAPAPAGAAAGVDPATQPLPENVRIEDIPFKG